MDANGNVLFAMAFPRNRPVNRSSGAPPGKDGLTALAACYNTCYNKLVPESVMNYSLKVISIGNSLGVILPKEALAELNVGKGDALMLSRTPEGFRVTPSDKDFEERMGIAHRIMKKRRNALRELAK